MGYYRRKKPNVIVKILKCCVFLCLLGIVIIILASTKKAIREKKEQLSTPTNVEVTIGEAPDEPYKPTVDKRDAWKDYPD